MARPNEFVDPDYDKRLAEFKAERDRAKKEMADSKVEMKRNKSY